MELMERSDAEFTHECGVTLLARTRASMGDKLAMDRIEAQGAADLRSGKLPKIVLASMGEAVARLFVVGWRGATLSGRPAAFSWETLMAGLPAAVADDFQLKLGKFLTENVDILKK